MKHASPFFQWVRAITRQLLGEIMQKLALRIASGMLMMMSTTVLAMPAITTVGVGAITGTLNCAKTSDGNCQWRSTDPSGYDTTGSATHTATSGASSVSDVRGSASASGDANLTSYLPTLHAYASSNASYTSNFSSLAGTIFRVGSPNILYTGAGSSIADANVWAVQGYQYTGLTPFALSVTGTLDSIFSVDGERGKIGHAGFNLSIFDAAAYVFDPNASVMQDYSGTTCPLFNSPAAFCSGGPVIHAFARNSLFNTGTLSLTVGHTFNPGDKFFVGVFMDASVCCGQTVDSSHTLNLAFNDYTQLVSIPVPGVVPEPDSVFLFMAGLVLIAVCRHRGRRRA